MRIIVKFYNMCYDNRQRQIGGNNNERYENNKYES